MIKRVFTGFGLVLTFSLLAFAQQGTWTSEHSPSVPSGFNFCYVSFLNQTYGWADGTLGYVLYTTDGGSTWNVDSSQITGTTNTLWGIDFVDSLNGFACGNSGTLIGTTDGGKTWAPLGSTPAIHWYALSFLDKSNGWIVGQDASTPSYGEIYRTTDGGTTWTLAFRDSVKNAHLDAIDFTDANDGWVSGWAGSILKTTDGGQTWKSYSGNLGLTATTLANIRFWHVETVDNNPDNVWLSTNVDILAHSTDGGTTWTADTLVPQQAKQTGLYNIQFTDSNHGWVTGYGQIFYTSDGGQTWTSQADTTGGVLPSDIMRGLSMVNGNDGYAVTDGGYIAHYSVYTPTVPTGPRLIAQANSSSSYFINANDTLFTWGNNGDGQLGDTTLANDSTAFEVPFPNGVTGWITAAGGNKHTLALGNDGDIYAWGYNSHGQLGNDSTTNSKYPVAVVMPSGVTKWTAVAAGAYHSLAIGNDGNVYAWGQNNFGELGDNSTTDSHVPVMVTLPAGATPTQVFAGANCSMALCSNGVLYAWGRNSMGQLGDGTETDSHVPVKVKFPSGVTSWTAVACGGYHVMAIGSRGNLYSWGSDADGQLGDGTTTQGIDTAAMVPMPNGVTGWTAIACGGNFSLALGNNGIIYGTGYNADGELGDDTNVSPDTLTMITMPTSVSKFTAVAAGWYHGLAIDSRDSVYAWGQNSSGQLGDGSTVSSLVPVEVLFTALPAAVTLPAPLLAAPANDDTLAVVNTALVWMSVPAATSYEVQLASDTSFTNIVIDSTVGADTSLTIRNMIDSKLSLKTKYFWRVKDLSAAGVSLFSDIRSFITPSSVSGIEGDGNRLPKAYQLSQNYPNPFNPTTIIRYSIPKAQFVTLTVYNVIGQKVATLANQRQSAGYYEVNFDGDRFASGVYFYILRAGHFVSIQKMLLLK